MFQHTAQILLENKWYDTKMSILETNSNSTHPILYGVDILKLPAIVSIFQFH